MCETLIFTKWYKAFMKEKSILEIGESVLSRGNQTTVPKAVRKALKLHTGDELTWHVTNQTVEVRKKEVS